MIPQIDALIEQLNSSSASQQAAAAEQLAQMDEAAQPAIVYLVHGTGSTDESVRNWCVAALEQCGRPAANQLSDLAALARAAQSDIAFWAVTMLGHAGRSAAGTSAALIDRLQDSATPAVQQRAAWALGQIGAGSPAVRSALQAATEEAGPLAVHAERALARIHAA